MKLLSLIHPGEEKNKQEHTKGTIGSLITAFNSESYWKKSIPGVHLYAFKAMTQPASLKTHPLLFSQNIL